MSESDALARLTGRTVAIDFDGVLHSYTQGWTGIEPLDPPMHGALDFVLSLLKAKVEVVIYTTRAQSPDGAAATTAWLMAHGFPPLPVTAGKPMAVAYIDDRAVPFRGSWSNALTDAAALA